MSSEREVLLPDVAATQRLAAELEPALRAGDIVGLVGELGAGKTEFVRGLARALGVPASAAVCSPSFVTLQAYPGGRLPLVHVDAYFARDPDDLERAGVLEAARGGAVVVVEWADRVASLLPQGAWWIELRHPEVEHGPRRALIRARDVETMAALRVAPRPCDPPAP